MKKEKAKVGRPKLADNDLKMNSIVICLMCLVVVFSLMIVGMFDLTKLKNDKLIGDSSNTFTVKYNLNNLPIPKLDNQKIKYGTATALREVKGLSSNYKFIGWIAKSSNGKYIGYNVAKPGKGDNPKFYSTSEIKKYYIYKNKATVAKTVNPGQIVTMEAVWTYIDVGDIDANTAIVHWDFYGFKPEKVECVSYVDADVYYRAIDSINITNFNKKQFALKKLHTNSKHSVSLEVTYNSGTVDSVYKEFKTTKGTFTVKYDMNSLPISKLKDQKVQYGKSTPLSDVKGLSSNYLFIGWIAKSNDGKYIGYNKTYPAKVDKAKFYSTSEIKKYYIYKNKATVAQTVNAGQTVTMVAVWAYIDVKDILENTAVADYNIYGLSASSIYCVVQEVNSDNFEYFAYPEIKYDKPYKFKKLKKDTEYEVRMTFSYNGESSKTIEKKFKTKKGSYTVKFDSNGGTGTMSDQKITYDVSTAIKNCTFTKSGYKFNGWKAYNPDTKKYYVYVKNESKAWHTKDTIDKNGYKYYLYSNKQKISKTVSVGKTVKFIAQWKANSNGSSGTTKKVTTTTKTVTSGKFEVKNNGNNCYTITAPKDAKYWRIHVYYKNGNKKYFGSQTKIANLSKNHYNDGISSQKVCFTKQKYSNETFRILLKWTTGANDKIKGTISKWKPTGWYTNSSIGWAYKDYNITW